MPQSIIKIIASFFPSVKIAYSVSYPTCANFTFELPHQYGIQTRDIMMDIKRNPYSDTPKVYHWMEFSISLVESIFFCLLLLSIFGLPTGNFNCFVCKFCNILIKESCVTHGFDGKMLEISGEKMNEIKVTMNSKWLKRMCLRFYFNIRLTLQFQIGFLWKWIDYLFMSG